RLQRVREAARGLGECTVRHVADAAVFGDAAKRDAVSAAPARVAIDGLMRHVEPGLRGQAVELLAGLVPGETRRCYLVVGEVRRYRKARLLDDGIARHEGPREAPSIPSRPVVARLVCA